VPPRPNDRHPARIVGALLATMTLALTTSGCGPVNAGSAAADGFEDWMSGFAHVADVSASGTNDLPFTGTAGGTVTLDPDLSADQVAAVVERALSFDSRPTVSVSIEYPAGDFTATYGVSRTDRTLNTGLDALARALDTDSPATTADIHLGPGSTEIVASGPGDFLAGFDRVRAVAAAYRLDDAAHAADADADGEGATGEPGPGSTPGLATSGVAVEYTSTDGPFTVRAGATGDAGRARQAFGAVARAYPVIGAELSDESVELRVDVPRTPDVATLVRTTARGIAVTVQFGNVTRTGEGDFAAAEAVTAAAQGAADVQSVEEQPGWVRVTVRDLAAALAVDAAVAALPGPHAALTLVADDTRFTLRPLTRGYAEYARTLRALDALGAAVTSVTVEARRLVVVLASGADVGAAGAALAETPRWCPLIVLDVGADRSLDVTPARPLAAADVTVTRGTTGSDQAVAALVTGWNAAG